MAVSYQDILKDLKARKFAPIYLLQGDEEYYIDKISDFIEDNVLSEGEKSFNQSVFYGKDADAITIANSAKRYPMMADYQVILVKEAQSLKKWDNMESYFTHPTPSTILVLCYKYGRMDKRLKSTKAIIKNGVLLDTKKLYDNQVPAWITDYVQSKGFKINARTGALVAEYLGAELSKISNELDKLMLGLPKGTEIDLKQVEENIGISKDFNVFELNSALAKKDVLKANRIINYFADNPKDHPLVLVLGALGSYFSKIFVLHTLKDRSKAAAALKVNPFFIGEYELAARNYPLGKVMQVISNLRLYDMRSKGVGNTGNTEQGDLMKELIFKILH